MIDTLLWDKRNIWINSSGDMVVREGLQHAVTPFELGMSEFLSGFSVENPRTGGQLHYILGQDDSDRTYIVMTNEEFYVLAKVYVGKGMRPSGPFQGAVLLNGQILMGAPGMPMFWGYVGNGFKIAQRTNSGLDVDFTTQSINDGLVVAWQNRVVIAARDALFFSDSGSPRAFLAANTVSTPGFVRFLKVSESGFLFMGTTEGMYQIAADTVYSGEVVAPVFQKVSEFPVTGFYQAALSPKGPVVLSEGGIQSAASYMAEELLLGDKRIMRTLVDPVHFEDFRTGALFQMKEGPILTMAAEQDLDSSTYFAMRLHEMRQIFSWIESAKQDGFRESIEVRAVLEDQGTEFIMTNNGIFRFFGNVDTLADNPIGRLVLGVMAGNLPVDPQQSPVVRGITTLSDNDGTLQYASIQGEQKSAVPFKAFRAISPTTGLSVTNQEIPIINTTEWYDPLQPDLDLANTQYYTRRLQSIRHRFSVRTNDIGIEIGVEGSGFRLGLISIETKGPGMFRAQDGKKPSFAVLEIS